jgi:hypothetical protein
MSTIAFSLITSRISLLTSREQAPPNGILELNLQDVEELDKAKGGTATLRADFKHEKAVTSAHWDPRGRSIASTCYDDVLRSMFCMVIARVLVLTHKSFSMGRLTIVHVERWAVLPY